MTRTQCTRCLSFILCLASVCNATERAADALPDWAPGPQPRIVEDRFRAEVLLLGAGFDTDLRLDVLPTVPGTDVNAEDDLGLDDSDLLPQVELTLLPGERHLLRLSWLNTRRSATRNIHREIVFDDEVYRAGERVDSTLDFTMFGLTYGRRLIVHERGELAVTVGVQVAEVKASAVVRSRVVREAEGARTHPAAVTGGPSRPNKSPLNGQPKSSHPPSISLTLAKKKKGCEPLGFMCMWTGGGRSIPTFRHHKMLRPVRLRLVIVVILHGTTSHLGNSSNNSSQNSRSCSTAILSIAGFKDLLIRLPALLILLTRSSL